MLFASAGDCGSSTPRPAAVTVTKKIILPVFIKLLVALYSAAGRGQTVDDLKPAEAPRTDRDKGFYYTGWTGGILLLAIKNAVLNILTLTIYRFWAKTDERRHLWRHTHFLGDPLEYTGVGKELFF